MINVEKALDIILGCMRPSAKESVSIRDAFGRIIAQDIISPEDIPGFDNSSMDGYAVQCADLKGVSPANPKVLKVVETVKAGDGPDLQLDAGQAIEIMTGAPIPAGADCVVMVEDTHRINDGEVHILKENFQGENIRRRGNNVREGELVIKKGAQLTAGHIGMLASLGVEKVDVSQKPTVGILATGDELVSFSESVPPGKQRSANPFSLAAQIKAAGGIPRDLGIARDRKDDLIQKIGSAADCDALITSGGVSMGKYDLVQESLREIGAEIKFWKVAMKPGKPVLFSVLNGMPVFSLAGNPVSSMINFEILVKPALAKILGAQAQVNSHVDGVLDTEILKDDARRHFIRALTIWKDGRYHTQPVGSQGSNVLNSMLKANSLIVMPEECDRLKSDSIVKVVLL